MSGPVFAARQHRDQGGLMKRLAGGWQQSVLLAMMIGAIVATAYAQHKHGSSEFGSGMQAGMAVMMKDMESAPMTGDPDKDFLAMMIPHHEGAVEMARLVLIHGKDPLVRRLAEEIIASQTVEIMAMKERLSILEKKPDPNPGGFPSLGGTRGEGRKQETPRNSGR
ncbi:MAG: DUF305 domain-containing protein [Nitrospirae bacterium]|nr:DUF305 domain-containing protein [Nitrospirota bacterium]